MAYKYPPNCLDEVNYCCFNQLSLSEDEAKGSSSEENILMGENLDITKYKAKNIRRPQRCVLERLETSDSVADLFPNLQSSLLMWSNPQKYTIKRSSSLYGLTYKGPWMFSQTVFVKQLLRYDLGARQAVLHELEMSDKFQSISPKLLAFAPYEQSIRIAFEYMPLDLPKLMETRLEINFNIPSELARIMGEVSDQGYLLREFRLEKFVGREGKLPRKDHATDYNTSFSLQFDNTNINAMNRRYISFSLWEFTKCGTKKKPKQIG